MDDSNTSPEMSSRILLRLGLTAFAVVGFTLALMAGGMVGAPVVAFTAFTVDRLLSAFAEDGPVTTSRLRNG